VLAIFRELDTFAENPVNTKSGQIGEGSFLLSFCETYRNLAERAEKVR
jgi:hypothetical protein